MIVLLAHAGFAYPRSGGVGVDVFFVLSGFLITGILSSDFARSGRIHLGNFYARRFLRLVPCLVLTCALFGALALLQHGFLPYKQIAVALTYTANWARALFDADLGSLAHCWSLAIEEQYYLFWPFVILWLERLTEDDSRKARLLAAAALLLAGYRAVMVDHYSAGRIYFGLDTHMDGLVFGSALSYLLRSRGGGLAFPDGRLLSYVLAPLATVAIAVLMGAVTWEDPSMGRWGFLVAALAASVLVADLVASPRCLFRSALAWRPCVYVGRISYGIYLLHFPIFTLLDHQLRGQPFALIASAKISLSLAAAAISFRFVEAPFLKMKKRFESAG